MPPVVRPMLAVTVASLAFSLMAGAERPAGVALAADEPGATFASQLPPRVRDRLLAIVCKLPPGQDSLPVSARRGLANHLQQYPKVSLATPAQRAAAERILEASRQAALRFRDVRAAQRAGFDTRLAKTSPPVLGILHAEKRWSVAGRRFFDPRRPKALIYANQPGRPLVLIGVMFSMPRGKQGPSTTGPIGRWHSHLVCVRGNDRGRGAVNGRCPSGARLAQGSEMLHIWFTKDVRSAYAVHAPVPELCRDGLLTPATCRAAASVGPGM